MMIDGYLSESDLSMPITLSPPHPRWPRGTQRHRGLLSRDLGRRRPSGSTLAALAVSRALPQPGRLVHRALGIAPGCASLVRRSFVACPVTLRPSPGNLDERAHHVGRGEPRLNRPAGPLHDARGLQGFEDTRVLRVVFDQELA